MGIMLDPSDQVTTTSNIFLSKDHEKANAKRVIFPEYWRLPKHFIKCFFPLDPNFKEKRHAMVKLMNRQVIPETQSLPYLKREKTELDSTLSLSEKRSSSRVSFNPKVSIHLFDLAEVEEKNSKKSPARRW